MRRMQAITVLFCILVCSAVASAGLLKIALFGDPHNRTSDLVTATSRQMGTQAIPSMSRAFTSMSSSGFIPDLVGTLGDNSTAKNRNEKTALLIEVLNLLRESKFSSFVVLGNHDFEYATVAEVRAALTNYYAYFQPGVLYGSFDHGNYHIIVLDTNYSDSPPHKHTGGGLPRGYLPGVEMDWLIDDLAATTKNTLVFTHQSLSEFNGSTFYSLPTSDINRFSTINRAAVRSALEKSGKVIAVFEGHQHFARWVVINGIPYMDVPSLVERSPAPIRLLAGDRGIWEQITIDDESRNITIDVYEDDTKAGVRKATSHTLKYRWGNYNPANPHEVYSFYNEGELTDWSVVTATKGNIPVDLWLSNNLYTNPFPNGLMIKGGRTSRDGYARHSFPSQPGKFILEFNINKQETDKTLVFTLKSGTMSGVGIDFDATSHITSAGKALMEYMSSTSYKVRLIVDVVAQSYDVEVNGIETEKSLPFNQKVASLNCFEIKAPAGQDTEAYLGAVYIAPFAVDKGKVDQ